MSDVIPFPDHAGESSPVFDSKDAIEAVTIAAIEFAQFERLTLDLVRAGKEVPALKMVYFDGRPVSLLTLAAYGLGITRPAGPVLRRATQATLYGLDEVSPETVSEIAELLVERIEFAGEGYGLRKEGAS